MRRLVLVTALSAGALVVVHALLWDLVRWDGDAFVADPAALVAVGAEEAGLFRASLLCDLFGSYLLTLPATLALWRLLRDRHPAVDVLALGGVVYAVAGAVAAGAYAVGGDELIRAFDSAHGARAEVVRQQFATLTHAAVATWQIVCVLAGGVWWFGSGWLLRERWTWFARYSMAFGALSLAVGAAKIAGVNTDVAAPATLAFLPIAVWIVWLGWHLSRAGSGVR